MYCSFIFVYTAYIFYKSSKQYSVTGHVESCNTAQNTKRLCYFIIHISITPTVVGNDIDKNSELLRLLNKQKL